MNRALMNPLRPGRFGGSVKLERYTPAPGTPKTCAACHDQKAIEDFGIKRDSPDGHDYYCRDCRAARAKKLYQARKQSVYLRRWRNMRGDTLLAMVEELLGASIEAKSQGLWRGRLGIRAYKRLCDAIEQMQRDGEYEPEAMEKDARPLHCDPADADWDEKRHATPERYRGRLS